MAESDPESMESEDGTRGILEISGVWTFGFVGVIGDAPSALVRFPAVCPLGTVWKRFVKKKIKIFPSTEFLDFHRQLAQVSIRLNIDRK